LIILEIKTRLALSSLVKMNVNLVLLLLLIDDQIDGWVLNRLWLILRWNKLLQLLYIEILSYLLGKKIMLFITLVYNRIDWAPFEMSRFFRIALRILMREVNRNRMWQHFCINRLQSFFRYWIKIVNFETWFQFIWTIDKPVLFDLLSNT